MTLLERLGAKLRSTLNTDCECDAFGNKVSDTPSRNWARNFTGYQKGMADMRTEQRECRKLMLLAKSGQQSLSDEDYAVELRDLAIEALRALPPGELEAEMKRRGLVVEVPVEREDDE